jgi:23S rRNA U2552 (ribose-2'-O)-methylase RlmE/FtsJ
MNIELLKKKLQEELGIAGYNLSNSELIQLVQKIKSTPRESRTNAKIQEIVKSVTDIDIFIIKESFDNSDLDNIIDQIEDALRNRS